MSANAHWHFTWIDDVLRGDGCPVHRDDGEPEWLPVFVVPSLMTGGASVALDLAEPSEALSSGTPATAADISACATHAFCDQLLSSHPLDRFTARGLLLPLLCVARC